MNDGVAVAIDLVDVHAYLVQAEAEARCSRRRPLRCPDLHRRGGVSSIETSVGGACRCHPSRQQRRRRSDVLGIAGAAGDDPGSDAAPLLPPKSPSAAPTSLAAPRSLSRPSGCWWQLGSHEEPRQRSGVAVAGATRPAESLPPPGVADVPRRDVASWRQQCAEEPPTADACGRSQQVERPGAASRGAWTHREDDSRLVGRLAGVVGAGSCESGGFQPARVVALLRGKPWPGGNGRRFVSSLLPQ
eukprot:scaffold1397_cov254-Pinguiococcus_pyrenoidosus.AAC.71